LVLSYDFGLLFGYLTITKTFIHKINQLIVECQEKKILTTP